MSVHLEFLRHNTVYVFHRVTSSVKSTGAPASEPSDHVMTSQRTARVCVVTSHFWLERDVCGGIIWDEAFTDKSKQLLAKATTTTRSLEQTAAAQNQQFISTQKPSKMNEICA